MSIRAQTPREALLEIRRMVATLDPARVVSLHGIDEVAMDGLSSSGVANFILADQLADRLAEAHKLLRDLLAHNEMGPWVEISGEIREALALPPDLEAMVERRIGMPGDG